MIFFIHKQSFLGFSTASIILVIIHLFSYGSFIEQRKSSNSVTYTHLVLEKLEKTFSDINAAEALERGYVITGRDVELKPYQGLANSINPQIEELQRLTADNPKQQQRLNRFHFLVKEKLAAMNQIIDLRKTQGFSAAQQVTEADWAATLMPRIYQLAHEMKEEEKALLKQRLEKELAAYRQQNLFSSAAIVADLLLFYLVYHTLSRESAKRKQAEARVLRDNEQLEIRVQERTAELVQANEQLQHEVNERRRTQKELGFLQSMKQAIFESSDFHTALGVTLQKVCEATDWNFGEAWIPRPDGSALECSSAWYTNGNGLEEFRRISEKLLFLPDTGIPGRVWFSRKPEWRQDVSSESKEVFLRNQAAINAGLKAALGIPIIANDEVVAVLVFYRFEARQKDQRLIELISASRELGLFIQHKRAEEEVYKALEQERELNQLKYNLITMISHEYRTPLTTIQSSAELLTAYSHKWTEEKKLSHLRRIGTTTQHMTSLINNVLFISKAEAHRLEFNPLPLNLEQLCQEIVEQIQLEAKEKTTIIFQCYGNSSKVCLDEKLLREILSNLLSNSIKYSPKETLVRFDLECTGNTATFKIQDTGIGIPKVDQPRVFESFHRSSNVGIIPGTGLGLTIVKKCVDLHEGQIKVESEVNIGTTFTITLPLNFSVATTTQDSLSRVH
jgi:signal transduction histidine kinase/CHASE3 domain sensor protein